MGLNNHLQHALNTDAGQQIQYTECEPDDEGYKVLNNQESQKTDQQGSGSLGK